MFNLPLSVVFLAPYHFCCVETLEEYIKFDPENSEIVYHITCF